MAVYILSDMYYNWYSVNDYGALSQNEKEHNATLAMSALRRYGFTKVSAAGIVGNMWAESGLSPGQWEGNTPFSGGYGLNQWTPYTLYSNWAISIGRNDWENNGPLQIDRIQYEKQHGEEFYTPQGFTYLTWSDYAALDADPEYGLSVDDAVDYAAFVWIFYYLRPANPPESSIRNRQYHARYVYHNCGGTANIPPWLLFKWAKLNRGIYT